VVNRGYLPSAAAVPTPDMSFVRLFGDASLGWQHRGQYAIWTGTSAQESRYRLLERIGQKVACLELADGGPVFHRIGRGTPFTIENMMGYWLTLDSDAMWLDTPSEAGRYALLAIGGAAGKPATATVDWTCPSCGTAIGSRTVPIATAGFVAMLKTAEAAAAAFDADAQSRRCGACEMVHPPTTAMRSGRHLQGGA